MIVLYNVYVSFEFLLLFIYMYVRMYVCVCVCMRAYVYTLNWQWLQVFKQNHWHTYIYVQRRGGFRFTSIFRKRLKFFWTHENPSYLMYEFWRYCCFFCRFVFVFVFIQSAALCCFCTQALNQLLLRVEICNDRVKCSMFCWPKKKKKNKRNKIERDCHLSNLMPYANDYHRRCFLFSSFCCFLLNEAVLRSCHITAELAHELSFFLFLLLLFLEFLAKWPKKQPNRNNNKKNNFNRAKRTMKRVNNLIGFACNSCSCCLNRQKKQSNNCC